MTADDGCDAVADADADAVAVAVEKPMLEDTNWVDDRFAWENWVPIDSLVVVEGYGYGYTYL